MHNEEHAKVANNVDNFKCDKCFIIDTSEEFYRKKNPYPKFPIDSRSSSKHEKSPFGPYFLIGSLRINNLGELDLLSDNSECLFPINYACSRLFWSTTDIDKKVSYRCRIVTSNILRNEKGFFPKNAPFTRVPSQELVTTEILLDYPLKSCNYEQANEEHIGSNGAFDLSCQVDGQNDKLDETPYKPTLLMTNPNVNNNNSTSVAASHAQSFGLSSQTLNQSKCIIRMPNSQTMFSSFNQTLLQQPATKIVFNANKLTSAQMLPTTTTSSKVFNINSQFKTFSNIKTSSVSPANANANIGAQLPFAEKPSVMRIENPPIIRIGNTLPINLNNSSANYSKKTNNSKLSKKSMSNNKKNKNHLKNLEVKKSSVFKLFDFFLHKMRVIHNSKKILLRDCCKILRAHQLIFRFLDEPCTGS